MATISTGQITNVSSASVASKATGTITLPANTLVFCDVLTYHSTPASVLDPTSVVGTGGETWVWEATESNGAGGGVHYNRYRTMVAVDTSTVVTATCAGTQTAIDLEVFWCGGVDTSGTWGSGACGASQTQGSGSAVTSASKSLGSPAHPRNGFAAVCRAGSGAMGSRTGWSEVYDSAGGGSYGQVQVQTIGSPDSTWSMTCSSSTYVAIITEVIAAPAPAVIRSLVSTYAGTVSAGSFTFRGVPGCTYVLFTRANSGTITPTTPGVTWTQQYNPSGGFKVWTARPTIDAEYLVTLSLSGSLSEVGWGLMEVRCDDSAYADGIIQQAHAESVSSPHAPSIATPLSRESCMLVMASGSATYASVPDGWQSAPRTLDNAAYGATFKSSGYFRANSDPAPAFTVSTGTFAFFWFAEFAGLPDVVEGDPPVIALVSPAEGAIAASTDIVVDVTDPDGDLSRVTLYLAMPLVGIVEAVYDWDTSAFLGAYAAASTVTPIANGFRFTLDRGGWVDPNITLHVVAHDEEGHETVEDFAWTTDFDGSYSCSLDDTGVAPVVSVEAPLPYDDPESPMSPTAWIVFTVMDEDNEPGEGSGIERAVPVIIYPDGSTSVIHDGDNFRGEFDDSGSTRVYIEEDDAFGYRYTVRPARGFWHKAPRLLPFAYDLKGNEAA